jgi:hypothetical protein
MKVSFSWPLVLMLLAAPGAYAGRDAAQIAEQQRIAAAVKAARAQLARDTQHGHIQLTWDARGQVRRVQ